MNVFAAAEIRSRKQGGLWHLLSRAFVANRPLTVMGAAMLITFLATLMGIVVDHRVITGAPAWLKPAKFALSVSVYCFTFVWLLGFVEKRPRLVRLVANVTVASFVAEMILIITQAARGTTSHFNLTTPFDSFAWITMGIFILFVWAMNLLLAIMLIWQRMPDRALAWSLRLGVLLSATGMAAAFFMVTPKQGQVAAIAQHHGPRIVGAHSVGAADGGPGLPVVGWSTVGGDLRVAHFVGLHALQVLPFLGWLLSRRKVALLLTANQRLALVLTAGLGYLGLILLLAWQALRGQSVVRPDAETITAAAALVAAVGVSVLITASRVLSRRRKSREMLAAIQILSREDV